MRQRTHSSPGAAISEGPALALAHVQHARCPVAGLGEAAGGDGLTRPAEIIAYLAEDHERIALDLNDIVVRRLCTVGLDLHAALGLMEDHRATGKICHAIDELDQAIRDIRDAVFGHLASEPPAR
jgi:signal transduction histidine kinase